jgi:3-dehydroquinate synthase
MSILETVDVRLGPRSYPIHIGAGVLADRELLARDIDARQLLIVTNDVVAPLYLDRLQRALPGPSRVLVLPDGERYKTLDTFSRVIDELVAAGFNRDACLVALGGGVIGDLGGFAAACYQRGIDYVQVPTTLLAQVDSSVGGKTAVNHPRAKNMIGAFHQPKAVLIDLDVLQTLPERELGAGLAEVIKYGAVLDAAFFRWLEGHIATLRELDLSALAFAIRRSCELKAEIVAEDERERGRRALLNFGHTFGHALEALGGYERWLHGEAVAIGMRLAALTSRALGRIGAAECERITALMRGAGLPTTAEGIDVDTLLDTMRLDKKVASGTLRLVLLEDIGHGVVAESPPEPALKRLLDEALGK